MGLEKFVHQIGNSGAHIYRLALGQDDRNVVSRSSRKSVSVETTYEKDLDDCVALFEKLPSLLSQLSDRYGCLDGKYGVSKRFAKIKFEDFSQTTIEMPVRSGKEVLNSDDYQRLVSLAWRRGQKPVRLMGLGLRLVDNHKDMRQLNLDLDCSKSDQVG